MECLDCLEKLLQSIPDVKISLFIPTAYHRTVNYPTEKPLYISMYKDFVNRLASLNPNNFELCYHGYHHGIPTDYRDNDEFAWITYEHATYLFNQMVGQAIFAKNLVNPNLNFKNVFRPPAWRCSAQALKALKDHGIHTFALAKETYALETYGDLTGYNVVWRTCDPPARPLKLEPKTCIVYHACQWDKNYLSADKADDLLSFILQNKETIQFKFMEEINNV